MPLLEISNLTVEFETRSGRFRAVDGVSLSVAPSEIVAVVGESGSGKSVAMLAIMGLLPPTAHVTADRMAFDGIDLRAIQPRQRRKIVGHQMAMIFQEPMTSLNPCFTVGFQIGEALSTHLGLGREARRQRTIELLDQVGIPEPAKRLSAFPHQLSGGMSQRVMIAMAISSFSSPTSRRPRSMSPSRRRSLIS
jgi:dipeptide transport system ATP-binding protein